VKENIVAGRYAQALFEEAKADNQADKVISQLGVLVSFYEESADFKVLVENPLITKHEKQAVIDELKAKGIIDGLLYKFITLMVGKNRLNLIGLVAEKVASMTMKDRGEAEAFVTVAIAMDDASKATLKAVLDKITGKKVSINETVDTSILGGVIAQVESNLYDASVRGQLNKIKEQLV